MTVGDVAFSASSLLGPTGGLIGLAFAAGATAGWNFAVRTVLKLTTKRIDDIKEAAEERYKELRDGCDRDRDDMGRRIAALELEAKDLRHQYTTGLEHQLSQVRQSTYDLIQRGQVKRFDAPDER